MRADLHIHSEYSGGSTQTIDTIIERATSEGFGAIAIVDHNTLEGSFEAVEKADIVVLRGIEITSNEGHILAYNMTELIPRDLGVGETIDLIHDADGVAVAAHPYRFWSGLNEREIRDHHFDALEVINGRSSVSTNHKTVRLANDLRISHTGGSDAHSPASIGRAATVFPDGCQTTEEMVDAILRGETMAVGRGRSNLEAISSGIKCAKEWFQRGMKNI